MSTIQYWMPIQKAWDKMVQVLFRPFDMGKWMVIGFAAFLANLGRESGNGGNFNSGNRSNGESWDDLCGGLSEVRDFLVDAWLEYTALIIVITVSILVLMIFFSILFNWLNSRGQFMFLDNVIKNRGAVQEPWREYRKEATSLMIFQILFNWFGGILVLMLLAGILVPILVMIMMEQFVAGYMVILFGSFCLLIAVSVACGFIGMIMNHFVVPLMYQRRGSILTGFRAFSTVLKAHFWRIILFWIVMSLVEIAIGVAVLLGILLTCCTALIVLIIPYIGTVALLPIYVFKRFMGLEFLRQLGDEYDLLSEFDKPSEEPILEP
jgi:hypothetical protein